MKALALALALACGAAAAEPPKDAPRMERVTAGYVTPSAGYFLNDPGYEKLAAETTRLQLAERAAKACAAEPAPASDSAIVLAVVAIASFTVGAMLARAASR